MTARDPVVGTLRCQINACHWPIRAATAFEELVQLQTHLHRAHDLALTLAEVREERAAWEARDATA